MRVHPGRHGYNLKKKGFSNRILKKVSLKAACTAQYPCLLISEYMDGGDVANLLKQDEHQSGLPLREALVLASDVLHGLIVVHSVGLIHRDLKPENILLEKGPPMRAKIAGISVFPGPPLFNMSTCYISMDTDFGCAISDKSSKTIGGTMKCIPSSFIHI